MKLTVELDRETDGRWIAEVVDLPGALVYGTTRDEGLAAAQALALRTLADKLEHGEAPAAPLDLSFVVVAAAQEAAHRTIEETSLIGLSAEDQRRFVELLLHPPELVPAMKRAKRAHADLIASD
jgi:uncharacterized protein (DUF1778 family)